MYTVAINAGSSSIKAKLFKKNLDEILAIHIEKFNGTDFYNLITIKDTQRIKNSGAPKNKDFLSEEKRHYKIKAKTVEDAINLIFKIIKECVDITKIDTIGHRVVHGGEYYHKPTIITSTVLKRIKYLFELAPLHNPINYAAIKQSQKICKKAKHVAIFDTAFHQTIPKEAYLYGLPIELYKKYKIRKYGFHGISHENVAKEVKKINKNAKKIISCHLGNGCSITAIKNQKSIDTSMGFTPLDGIMMGTRSGSFDPEIILYLINQKKLKPKDVNTIINKKSGFKGITNTSDMRKLHKRDLNGDAIADLGIEMFVYDIIQQIGAYTAALNGIDAIAFTGGIGEQAWYIRKAIIDGLSFLGVSLNSKENKKNSLLVHSQKSKVKIYIIPANEELAIARQANTAK